MATDDGTIFSQYPVASWKVGATDEIFFPVLGITESGGNRIVPHERPFRDGAKLDDTGGKPRSWSFTALFSNNIQEPGCESNPRPLYPDMLRALVRSFDEHQTGDLTLPTVGKVRARAAEYTRKEDPEARDMGVLELTFAEDNEDALDRALFTQPAVVATLVDLAEKLTFVQQKEGFWNEDVKSLTEISLEIEALLLAPGRSVVELQAVVATHRRALQRVIGAMQQAAKDGGYVAAPRGNTAERQLRIMMDREAAAEEERTASRPRTKAFVVDVERTNIFEIAARLDQAADELLDLNAARMSDPFLLTRGEVIRVFESAPR